MRLIGKIFWIFCCAICSSAHSRDDNKIADLNDQAIVVNAVRSGNYALTKLLLDVYKTDPIANLFNASDHRVHFQTELSSDAAKKCFANASKSLETNAVQSAINCGEIFAGNFLLKGNMPEWAREKLKILAWIYSKQTNISGSSVSVQEPKNAKLQEIADWPQMAVHDEGETATISITWRTPSFKVNMPGLKPQPYVSLVVNGRTLNMLLDTGTSVTAMDSETAKSLGIKRIVRDFANATDSSGAKEQNSIGLVDSLEMGHAKFSNLPVLIGNFQVPLLGLNVLTQLNSIRIMHDKLDMLSANDSAELQCSSPLIIASNMDASTVELIMTIKRDDQNTIAFFDSGDTSYLVGVEYSNTGSKDALHERSRATIYGTDVERYHNTIAQIDFGPKREKLEFPTLIDSNQRYKQPYIIGSAALNDLSVFFNFRKRRACFLKP